MSSVLLSNISYSPSAATDTFFFISIQDAGIDRAVVRTVDGVRVSSTTSIQTLIQSPFDLVINDRPFRVVPPPQGADFISGTAGISREELQRMGDVRALVGQLYEAMNVEEHQVRVR